MARLDGERNRVGVKAVDRSATARGVAIQTLIWPMHPKATIKTSQSLFCRCDTLFQLNCKVFVSAEILEFYVTVCLK